MNRWQEISAICQAALSLEPRDRSSFVADACAGNAELRREVQSLLAAEGRAGSFMETPALELAAGLAAVPTFLVRGNQLARYRIVELLGRGGMGEVYRARDEQLARDVAIKVLPASSFDDHTARGRLVNEARASAALNHPHICTVHEVGEANGQTYIAMELVEGKPLSAHLLSEPLSAEHVVRYGVQLASALAHAHERGVLHRDLKAANVVITPDGRVKVLDFGLAKRFIASDFTGALTQTQAPLTQPGTVMGTLAYMAPEQLRGLSSQVSSDVWALGVVLYEMAAGTRPFQGHSGFELSAAILNDPPRPLPAHIPPNLQAVIARCLEKDQAARYQVADDVRSALEAIPAGVARPRITRRRAIAAAAAMAGASGLVTWSLWPRSMAARSLAVLPFTNTTNDEDFEYLSDGITESLIRQASTLRSLEVAPRSAVFNFKKKAIDPGAAGRQLGVDTVLAGTLTVDGGRLLVTAQLVDAASGTRLWNSTYDRRAGELLSIQDEIASAIMENGLRLQLTSDERLQLVRNPTSDGEAYDLYLQARHLQRRATEEDYLASRELLRRAIVRDPKFVLAYMAMAGNYAMMAADGLERPTDAWPQASRYARQALELDPNVWEAHVISHAQAFFFDWDWAGAERERRIVLQGLSGEVDPQFLRALSLEHWALGRPMEALELARRTRERDPLSPNLNMLEADYLVHAGQLDAAVDLYVKSIRSDPTDPNAYFGLAELRYRQGRFDDAIEARRRAHAVAGDDALKDLLVTARGEQGYRQIDLAWVRLQLQALKERAATSYVSPLDFARVYAQLDDDEQAFRHLESAFLDRSPGLVYLKVDRAWDTIRNDPRFAAAVRRIGLP